ncbi:DNA/RNA helicase [Pueribacillus theae]|uniref:DNA/RNA helicase n=1 Tax=Pueribacillus theae TaxID=2171751 RepID=A0A2U1K5H7_9BACI|nr:DEAD/DEAH box helicase [Pueribacillus theae]PWA12632.1 DNA/RNA helicase [Pueribacillus theae]
MRYASYSKNQQVLIHPEGIPFEGDSLSSFSAISRLDDFEQPPLDFAYPFSPTLQYRLQGKLLLLDELPFSIDFIHSHYLHGYVGYKKSITNESKQYCCHRCGNTVQRLFASFSCARCLEECTYCRKCLVMGRVSECTPLIYWCGSKTKPAQIADSLKWKGELSVQQTRAADAVLQAIERRHELLIWAVCGAGKTEILFEGLARAFSLGLRVCIATPRVDVVLELLPRLKEAFPKVIINALYGGSVDKEQDAQLIISTTHQLLRFQDWFDVMIVDEVDAFPYSMDRMLEFAVERSKKEGAPTIYLTATPNESFKIRAKEGTLPSVKIPIRFHRHPLPVPFFQWCGDWQKKLSKEQLPKVVHEWCKEKLRQKKQIFLFVPSVNMMKKVKEILASSFSGTFSGIDGVHAEDPERKEKIEKFRKGEIQLLVTTTILERGVTVPNIDVGILGAEDQIFTESALVQIAGRAGRSGKYPTGEVRYFHFGKTEEMMKALHHIEEMNEEAKTL